MKNNELLSALSAILQKAKEFGVHLAGFANVNDLKSAPPFDFAPKMPGALRFLNSIRYHILL